MPLDRSPTEVEDRIRVSPVSGGEDAAPTHVFIWYADPGRGDLLSVNVESDLVRRAGRVTVRGRDPLQRSTVHRSPDVGDHRSPCPA